jgi:hypothetical protein
MTGVNATFPFEPKSSRLLGIEIVMDLESERASEVLSTLTDDQVVISQFSDRFRN